MKHALTEITGLLANWRAGDADAEQALAAQVYPVLRAMAQKELAAGAEGKLTLHATELAHEVYIRLLQQNTEWESRTHFMAIIARVMRRVVVDLVRRRQAAKRGPGERDAGVDWNDDAIAPAHSDDIDWLALDQALVALAARDPIAARVVELRYFGGLDNSEIADVLGIGTATVVRHWQFARAWLHSRL